MCSECETYGMNMRMKAAFACHFLATLIAVAFGLVYLLRGEFMPYHAVAVGMSWNQVDSSFQVLIVGLMRALGGACLAVAVLQFILLLVPFRRGEKWACWAIPAGGLVIAGTALYVMVYVALNTPATPPWPAPAAAGLLLVVGLLLSLGDG
jgi:hypothetical protein